MSSTPNNALVIYKNQLAHVTTVGDKKIHINTADGQTVKVRHKDVTILHPGPITTLGQLKPAPAAILDVAWELLAGNTVPIVDIAELAYEEFTPQNALTIWQLLQDGLYISGSLDEIYVHTPEEVTQIEQDRAAQAAEAAAWAAFVDRLQANQVIDDDSRYLQEVAALAYGQQSKSRVLDALGRQATPENAQDLLLQLGQWTPFHNPHPRRGGISLTTPDFDLPALPDEPRQDLTHLAALAIDDAGNQDPDDALSWEDGRLWVHIADVAALITPDSPADIEARNRAANLYLPEGVIPMLPPPATEQLALGLQETSPALSFSIELDDEGNLIHFDFTPSWVKVTRISYAEAEAKINDATDLLINQLHTIAQTYLQRRLRQNAIELNLPEAKVAVNDETITIRPLPPLRSRELVREAMLMVGEGVARWALTNNVPIPYTMQDPPLEPLPPLDSLSAMMNARRFLTASQQVTTPKPHAGLGMPMYAQTTSPLRRYLDLVIHQQLRAFHKQEPLLDEAAIVTRIGTANAMSGELRFAERQSIRHWTLVYLHQRPDWEGEAVVVDTRRNRSHIVIPELAFDTWISGDKHEPDTTVRLRLQDVDLVQLEAFFQIIDA
ncbi:MAG TPA: RNB domain-containing ribonuclease [Anaerolineae bacterium]|nr:RNB domain-containing ribonuclease [Anaerolineae bacterium]